MKILALGNSFSEDATAYLEHLAPALYVRNLHIPGCSLETHAAHLAAGDKAYVFQEHGRAIQPEHVAANAIMAGTPWDVVTVQQASHFSGLPETYEPYLTEVLAAVRALCPGARIVFHETWAYATDSTHPQFSHYHNDQTEMAHAIRATAGAAASAHGLGIIALSRICARTDRRSAMNIPVTDSICTFRTDATPWRLYGRTSSVPKFRISCRRAPTPSGSVSYGNYMTASLARASAFRTGRSRKIRLRAVLIRTL